MRIFIFLLFFAQICFAQTQIKGFVLSDATSAPVKANVILLNEKNDIETYGFTNKDGSFSLSVDRNVNVTLPTKITNYYSKKDKAVPYRKYVEKNEEQQEILRQQFISNLPKGTMLTAPDLKQKRKIDLEREYEWEIEN